MRGEAECYIDRPDPSTFAPLASPLLRAGLLVLASLLLGGGPSASALAAEPGLIAGTLQAGGLTREYWLHLPRNAGPDARLPLLLVLHGGGGADARTMAQRYDFDEIADREGFMVVYPYGVDGQWNDGRGVSFRRKRDNSQVDDVAFIDSLVEDLARRHPVDRSRIYATGVSNGGMMTFRLGVELGHKLAAIAPVIANLPASLAGRTPAAPLPVLIMNGTEDPLVPWHGGQVRVFGKDYGEVLATRGSVDYWLAANRLSGPPETEWLPDLDGGDGCRVERSRQGGGGREVVLYTLHGGGHNVPGAHTPDRPRLLGRKCMDINAAEEIWRFFSRHVRSGATSRTGTGGPQASD